MKLGISLLAFDTVEDFISTAPLLKSLGINYIESVPTKLDTFTPAVKEFGFKQKSLQSLLYQSGIKDFLDPEFKSFFFDKLPVWKSYGIDTLVLGSPSQRKDYSEVKLLEVFSTLDKHLQYHNITLCLEPNCGLYSGQYFFNLDEIVSFLSMGGFSNIKTMIDTHNLLYEDILPNKEYQKHSSYISHVHVSELKLAPYVNSLYHQSLSKELHNTSYDKIITYEVFPNKNLNLNQFTTTYGQYSHFSN
tara:strand:- start:527 stop:1267 length:741 start_codon:yes stop_codon:yes gene_type:complete